MIAGLWLRHQWEFVRLPVKFTRVHHDTPNPIAMSAQPLGEGVDDDVRTMIDGTLQIRGAEGGIHDQRQPMIVRNFGDGLDISYIQPWIAHRFAEEQLGLGGNGLGKILRIIRVHKVGVDIELRKDVFELRVAAPVKIIGRNDIFYSFFNTYKS